MGDRSAMHGQLVRRREFLRESSRAALGCSLLALSACSQENQKSNGAQGDAAWTTLISEWETQIPELLEENLVPGLSMALVRDGKLAWRRGFGVKDSASKAAVDNDTVFEAASMSKPVFAYAVMKLCEKGVLDLDTPLTKYTSERFLEGDPRLELITARYVLSHASGFQNWRSPAKPLAIHFDPGAQWLYSGEGYNYLQSVVTHLTGHVDADVCGGYEADYRVCATDFDEYMKAQLLVPFGMDSSGYVWNDLSEKRMARPHDKQGKPLENKKSTALDVARYGSAGALLATPADYAKFLIEVIDPKPSDASRLTTESVREMLRPQMKVEVHDEYSISWSLGWRIAHTKDGDLISHGGDNAGFHCVAGGSVARKSGFVIMTNGDNGVALLGKLAPAVDRGLQSLPDGRQ